MVGRNSFPNIHNSLLGSLAAIDSAFTTVHLLLLPWCHHSSLAIIDTQFGDVSSNLRQVSTTHKIGYTSMHTFSEESAHQPLLCHGKCHSRKSTFRRPFFSSFLTAHFYIP